MNKTQPNKQNVVKKNKSKSRPRKCHNRRGRNIAEILASDDEFPDSCDDTPNIPDYIVDDSFNAMTFPWLDNMTVRHYDTEIKIECSGSTGNEDFEKKDANDNVTGQVKDVDVSKGAIKKTQLGAENMMDNTEKKKKKKKYRKPKMACQNVLNPLGEEFKGAIQKPKCGAKKPKNYCDNIPNIPDYIVYENFDAIPLPCWRHNMTARHYKTKRSDNTYNKDVGKKDTIVNITSQVQGVDVTKDAIKETQLGAENMMDNTEKKKKKKKYRYTKKAIQNVQNPLGEESKGAVQKPKRGAKKPKNVIDGISSLNFEGMTI